MLCRLCVNESTDFTEIFQDEGLEYNVSNLIDTYFSFNVPEDDENSTVVCRLCLDNLRNFNSFCCSVESAQEKWETIHNLIIKDDEQDPVNHEVELDENEVRIFENEEVELYLEEGDDDTQGSNADSLTSLQDEGKSKKSQLSGQFDRLIAEHTNLFCNECNAPMENFRTLKKHFKDIHEKTGYMICCKRKFFRAADLADHINIHLNPEYFKCLQCDKSFSSRYSLDFHMKTIHVNEKGEKKSFKCIHCSRKFLTQSVLERHNQTQCKSKPDPNKHMCMECGKGYPTETKLKAHHFNVHTMVYSKMCHLCGKVVRGNKALEHHQLQHAGKKPKVQCEICGAELSTKGILKAHMIALHPEDSNETHECNICAKIAPSKRALKHHMDYVHNCEKLHKCHLCEKSFKRLQALKEHITTHTGDRLYQCTDCPKTFKVRSNMYHHRKQKHPNETEGSRSNRPKQR